MRAALTPMYGATAPDGRPPSRGGRVAGQFGPWQRPEPCDDADPLRPDATGHGILLEFACGTHCWIRSCCPRWQAALPGRARGRAIRALADACRRLSRDKPSIAWGRGTGRRESGLPPENWTASG